MKRAAAWIFLMLAAGAAEATAIEYTAMALRDPFESSAESGAETSSKKRTELQGLKVDGIVWSEYEPRAIINGKIVKRGSRIGEHIEVIDIERHRIKVSYEGEELSLNTKRT